MPAFDKIPTESELLHSSRQIDQNIAEQILKYSCEWSMGSDEKRLDIVNHLVHMVDSLGKHTWHDIVWTYLVNRIRSLSDQINETINAANKKS